MILMPIVYVSDMGQAVEFYERLGFSPGAQSRSAMWTELRAAEGAILALHGALDEKPAGTVELSMVADQPLDAIAGRGPLARGIADEAFGRSLVLLAPDGLSIQVNEHDPELYTA